jgi:hypothetical protein
VIRAAGSRSFPRALLAVTAHSAAALACMTSGCESGGVALIGREEAVATCAPACAATLAGCGVNYCASLPSLSAAPILDGLLECGLSLTSIDPAGWSGNETKPADLAVAYAAAWRPDGIYFFVQVEEAQRLPAPLTSAVYCGDAAHIFVDDDGTYAASPAYDVPGTLQLVAAAPADASTPVSRGTIFAPPRPVAAWDAGHFPTPGGYVLEAFVPSADLGHAAPYFAAGGRVGMDVAISYGGTPSLYGDSNCPKRGDFVLRQISRSAVSAGLPHDDTRAFCNPVLGTPTP